MAIQEKVFDFIYHELLEKNVVFRTALYFRRIHDLLAGFIEFIPSIVIELRAPVNKTVGTNNGHHFEMLLLTIRKLYSNDKMNLNPNLNYWETMKTSGTDQHKHSMNHSLLEFVIFNSLNIPHSTTNNNYFFQLISQYYT